MRRYQHLLFRIPASTEPTDYRAFISELEKLPQDDQDVQSTLQRARSRLAEAEAMAHFRAAYRAGTYAPHLPRISYRGIPPNGMAVLINPGPDRYQPLEKHREFIAWLEALPQNGNSIRYALQDAHAEMAWAERIQGVKMAKAEELQAARQKKPGNN
jgi:hypothetical protein